ncbi:50S ribosomal protein L11 methyltransferase [Prevotella communis]|uniref:50S ribosomal protein L11 methyltransferase n=1 Tax=Prevotella communis TaxID=2913614 RepID=UPI001ED9D6F9|nr:50S ribosomal protein L11 methyltransferase [Prevotella communis]UKK55350.1 50S ribosomal protein L11 methyltransferase [Prevotella communis]
MKYYEVNFTIEAPAELMQDARDILSALAGEAGFETFEDTDEGVKGYVQQGLFDEALLKALIGDFPLPSCTVAYTVSEAEDKDWNEQWEQQGFEPIVVNDTLVIHDGRHLPQISNLKPQTSNLKPQISIEIDAHLAFGTGTHETTRMMVGQLMSLDLTDKRVLDCGTGTGILGIAALKLGAREAVGYDIDEWSADNARHNAVINMVDGQFTSLLGDASILKEVSGQFDVVLANINRNILLNDMEAFVGKMAPHSTLLLSGFYEQDIPLLEEKAASLGLKKQTQQHDGDWACLMFMR